jgi:hypothetical protein
MKHPLKWLLFAGSCFLLAVPANAQVNWSGYGELEGGGGLYHGSENATSFPTSTEWVTAGAGRVNLTLDSGLDLQLDAQGRGNLFEAKVPAGWSTLQNPKDQWTYGFGAHFDLRGDEYRAGTLFSFGDGDWFSTGLEGAWYLDRTTLFSQFTYSAAFHSPGPLGNPHYWYLDVGGRYFLLDNLMFELNGGAGIVDAAHAPLQSSFTSNSTDILGSVSVTSTTIMGGTNGDILHWSAKTEYRFDGLPLSLAFDYQGTYATARQLDSTSFAFKLNGTPFGGYSCNSSGRWKRTENVVMLRLRYYFGEASLIANDRYGAGMNDYNPLYGAEQVSDAGSGYVPLPPPVC